MYCILYAEVNSGSDPNCATAPVFYLTAANTGLLVGKGASVNFGGLEPQATLTFNNSSLSGNFFVGPLGTVSQSQQTEVGEVTLGSGSGTTITDLASTTNQEGGNSGTISYSVNADGTVTTMNGGLPVVQFIIIDSSRFVTINDVTNVYPYITISQQ